MTFPQDFDIFRPSGPKIIPWLNKFLNGSLTGQIPRSYKKWVQNLAYSKCPTACSWPPIYKSTGSHFCILCFACSESKSINLFGASVNK
ncbi:Uncharacterised protein [Mycoplasma putrefaciens]|nr:Uncharacterised protein [Mycoplasma putrefaciens]